MGKQTTDRTSLAFQLGVKNAAAMKKAYPLEKQWQGFKRNVGQTITGIKDLWRTGRDTLKVTPEHQKTLADRARFSKDVGLFRGTDIRPDGSLPGAGYGERAMGAVNKIIGR